MALYRTPDYGLDDLDTLPYHISFSIRLETHLASYSQSLGTRLSFEKVEDTLRQGEIAERLPRKLFQLICREGSVLFGENKAWRRGLCANAQRGKERPEECFRLALE